MIKSFFLFSAYSSPLELCSHVPKIWEQRTEWYEAFFRLLNGAFDPVSLGVHCVEWESWAKFGYYKISQPVLAFWRSWKISLLKMRHETLEALHSRKYSPSPFRWEGRTFIKISYLHFIPSVSFPVVPWSQIVQITHVFREWIVKGSLQCEIFPRLGWLGKAWMLFWTWDAVHFCSGKEPKPCRETYTQSSHLHQCTYR